MAGQTIDIIVPEGVSDATVLELMKELGASVREEESLLALETDKATAELPAPAAGKVVAWSVKVGDTLSSGDVVGKLELAGSQEAPGEVPIPREPSAKTASEPSPQATSGGFIDIVVPEGVSGATVLELMKEPGASVREEESLLALETDKATAELPAPAAGTLAAWSVKLGDTLSSGDVVGKLELAGATQKPEASVAAPVGVGTDGTSSASPAPSAAPQPSPNRSPGVGVPSSSTGSAPQNSQKLGAPVHASPSVRQLGRELGVDLSQISQPSGPKGRITFADVKAWVKSTLQSGSTGGGIPKIDLPDFSKFGPTENLPLGKIKQLTGSYLSKGWLNIPLVTHFEEADITSLEDFRKGLNNRKGEYPKCTPLAFIVKAVVRALQEFPQVNSSLASDGKSLILKKYYHIGIAVDTPRGLLVPVIRDAERLSIDGISAYISELGAKGRSGKLGMNEMEGGTFTISSLGGLGGNHFTPLVNPPEAAILGVARSEIKPVWNGKEFEPRLMLPFSISYDHRILDGGEVARFGTRLRTYLEDLRHILV